MTLSKTEIQEEIKATEERLAALRKKMDAPERPAPKPGDVIEDAFGVLYLCDVSGHGFNLRGCHTTTNRIVEYEDWELGKETNLGNFHDVFIRRDEVRKAVRDILDTPDEDGDTLDELSKLSDFWLHLTSYTGAIEIRSIVKKLKELAE